MKTTVEIADPLFKQAKALAAREGLSFRDLVEEGLQAAVEARTKAVSKPFRLRDGSFKKGHGLQPGLKWADLTSMAYEGEGGSLRP
ncbi:MAG: DUF2191 domain-containing protein [Acidobacteria bacterium]|nr:DUF2191 domain-containing protein [Acidobacteriota bacterium]